MKSDDPAVASANNSVRFEFVKLQVSYYMTQMTIGEAKAGGILALLVALIGFTSQRITEPDASTYSVIAGVAALLASICASAFAFAVIWPRRINEGPPGSVFSWVTVSATPIGDYLESLQGASDDKLTCDIATTMVEIAFIIRRKYQGTRRALIALVPATALHVLNWLLA
jgi:Family of unknown function (DUF5706)